MTIAASTHNLPPQVTNLCFEHISPPPQPHRGNATAPPVASGSSANVQPSRNQLVSAPGRFVLCHALRVAPNTPVALHRQVRTLQRASLAPSGPNLLPRSFFWSAATQLPLLFQPLPQQRIPPLRFNRLHPFYHPMSDAPAVAAHSALMLFPSQSYQPTPK